MREQGYEDPWLLFEAKRGPRAKYFGEILVQIIVGLPVRCSTSGAAYYVLRVLQGAKQLKITVGRRGASCGDMRDC